MKRRSFIFASLLSLLGVSALSFIRWVRKSDQNKILAQPKFLSLLCDDATIRMLGQTYLKLKPGEAGDHILLDDLLNEKSHKIFVEKQDVSIVETQIEKKVIHDFDTNDIIVVQGWVLSVTEARQCAFFSILNA